MLGRVWRASAELVATRAPELTRGAQRAEDGDEADHYEA